MTGVRTCPSCGAPERRWTVGVVEHVNLNPLTGACVDCTAALSKETGPLDREQSSFEFDARAEAARNDA